MNRDKHATMQVAAPDMAKALQRLLKYDAETRLLAGLPEWTPARDAAYAALRKAGVVA